jgi:hypothetical protein
MTFDEFTNITDKEMKENNLFWEDEDIRDEIEIEKTLMYDPMNQEFYYLEDLREIEIKEKDWGNEPF